MNDYLPLVIQEKSKKKEWVPEYLYIEAYIPDPPKKEIKEESSEDSNGIIVIQMI